MAIGIKVKETKTNVNPNISKFFGDPVIPRSIKNNWSDGIIFFCQIKMNDIAPFDLDNILPHEGYVYIFLDTETIPYTPKVYYTRDEPEMVIDDFNAINDKFSSFTKSFEMVFFKTDDDADGIKLLGNPSDWNYDEVSPSLFMQFDPLASDMGFLDEIDGYVYFFFDKSHKIENIYMHIERS